MARVIVIETMDRREVHISEVQATAAWLKHLGDNASPCRVYGCRRPTGHPGRHYRSEDEARMEPLNPNTKDP